MSPRPACDRGNGRVPSWSPSSFNKEAIPFTRANRANNIGPRSFDPVTDRPHELTRVLSNVTSLVCLQNYEACRHRLPQLALEALRVPRESTVHLLEGRHLDHHPRLASRVRLEQVGHVRVRLADLRRRAKVGDAQNTERRLSSFP